MGLRTGTGRSLLGGQARRGVQRFDPSAVAGLVPRHGGAVADRLGFSRVAEKGGAEAATWVRLLRCIVDIVCLGVVRSNGAQDWHFLGSICAAPRGPSA